MSRYNIKIETGIYTGNGSAQTIAPACDGPNWVLTKRINGTATVCYTLWDKMGENKANSFGGAYAEKVTQIMALTADGFHVGAGQSQNAALYAYLAIKGMGGTHFQTGRYVGGGTDNRDIINTNYEGTGFQPDLVGIHAALDGQTGRWRSKAHTGDSSQTYTVLASNNNIQGFATTGFQIGTSQNVALRYYNWFAIKEVPGGIKFGSYVGTGVAQNIDVGFRPTCVFVQNRDTNADMYFLTQGMLDNSIQSHPVTGNAASAGITAFTDTGFTVGTIDNTNKSGDTLIYWAFKDGEYAVPVTRNTL